jgi:hypothetical protein
MSNGGGMMLLLTLLGVVGWLLPLFIFAELGWEPAARSRERFSAREARLRRLNRPSVLLGGETVDSVEDCVFPSDGVRSFHAATMLRTDVRGERGDVCGRRKGETVGVILDVFVALLDAVNVLENVLAKSLGLNCVPLLLVVMVGPAVGGDNNDVDESASEIEDDDEEIEEPALLFVGDEGREPYPVDVPYPVVVYP